jgi:hypothetical protein
MMLFFTIKPLQLTTALLNKVQINNSHILLAKTDQQRWMSLSCLAPNANCKPVHNRKLVFCESVLTSPAMEWCEVYFGISSRFHIFHIVHTYLKLSQIVYTYSHSPADNRLTNCYRQFVSSTAHGVVEVWLLVVELGCGSSCCFLLLFVVCWLFLELECMLSVTAKEVVCELLLVTLWSTPLLFLCTSGTCRYMFWFVLLR